MSKQPETIHYALKQEFGGPASADLIPGTKTYTVSFHDAGRITRENMSYDLALKAQQLLEEGNHRKASLILNPIF